MDPRIWLLSIPSAAILALLVAHSLTALPRRRAVAFWCAVLAFGVLRGVGVRLVTERALSASFPYVIHRPLFTVAGVSLQEIAGWAIVCYLGWWIAARLTPRLVLGSLSACVFLGAVSLAIETTAVAAGFWHWTVPAAGGILGEVPVVGLVDWFFVGVDFLLPFRLLTARAPGRSPARFLVLGAFPVHFAAHAIPGNPLGGVSILDVAHWILLGALLWFALRSRLEDRAFVRSGTALRWAPITALAAILVDLALVDALWVRRPALLLSLVPAAVIAALSISPLAGAAIASQMRRSRAAACMVLFAAIAVTVELTSARRERDLRAGLDAALAARDRGDIAEAVRILEELTRRAPGSHAPHAFLGEIHYRTGRTAEARNAFLDATRIKQDFVRGYRYLAVLDLQLGDAAGARSTTERALDIAPRDVELLYLDGRARGGPDDGGWNELLAAGPRATALVASLAYEVGDGTGAARALDLALDRWPGERELYEKRVRLALAQNDAGSARRVLEAWTARWPEDREAAKLRVGTED